jgi:hypothetical protein
MKPTDINASLVDFYLKLLSGLSTEVKLDLISKLVISLKPSAKAKKLKELPEKSILGLAGKWQSDETAEELVQNIRNARVFNRQIETF